MTPRQILKAYDLQLRRDAPAPPNGEVVQTPWVTRLVERAPQPFGSVVYSCLSEQSADQVIDEELAHWGSKSTPLEWKVYGHDQPQDLVQRLLQRGFIPGEPETLLAFDGQSNPLMRTSDSLKESHVSVRDVRSDADLDTLIQIQTAVWGGDGKRLRHTLEQQLREPDNTLSAHIAYAGDQPGCAGWIRFYPNRPFADLWGGSTVPPLRGQGLYSRLVQHRLEQAQRRGVRFVTVDAMASSQPILARYGFIPLTSTTPYLKNF